MSTWKNQRMMFKMKLKVQQGVKMFMQQDDKPLFQEVEIVEVKMHGAKEMITVINRAPAGYKTTSYDKARTVLLDECVRDVEKGPTSVKDTWYTQGVSIVSDGWSNVKHQPLLYVIVVNSHCAMFMYARDFFGQEQQLQISCLDPLET